MGKNQLAVAYYYTGCKTIFQDLQHPFTEYSLVFWNGKMKKDKLQQDEYLPGLPIAYIIEAVKSLQRRTENEKNRTVGAFPYF